MERLLKLVTKRIIITSIMVVVIAIAFLGMSYAIYFVIDEKNIGTVTFGQLSFEMCLEESCSTDGSTYGTAVGGTVYPMNTSEGLSRTPYLFKVTNNGNTTMYTKVYAAKEGDSSDYTNVKLAAKERGTNTYSYADLTYNTSVLIDLEVPVSQTKIIEVYMWLDEEAENDMIGKTITAFINAIGYYKPSDPNNLHTADRYVANVSAPLLEGQAFNYTGNYQEFEAPLSGYYFVEAWGAQGGSISVAQGGKGAYTSGYIYMSKGEKLYIYVGENVASYANKVSYNGGGRGSYSKSDTTKNGNGGGATDIRYFGNETPTSSDLQWDSTLGLNSRIMVAAGGGGAIHYDNSGYANGGFGGGLIGGNGLYRTWQNGATVTNSTGGSQIAGGVPTNYSGTVSGKNGGFGIGGTSNKYNDNYIFISGGGAGYYGGGSGDIGTNAHGSAAGGSSFISGYAGVNAITASNDRTHTNNTLHYSGKYFLDGKMESNVREGNGQARIKYIGLIERKNAILNNVRYIKDCIYGNNVDSTNRWNEIQAIKDGVNIAKGLNATMIGGGTINSKAFVTDGDIGKTSGADAYSSSTCVLIDLGATYDLDEIAVWHNWYFNSNTPATYVSSNNSNWTTIINAATADTSDGKRVNVYEY